MCVCSPLRDGAEDSPGKKLQIWNSLLIIQFFPADRAKAIKTTAVINESPTDRLIRELREENARLMDLIKKGALPPEMLQQMAGGAADGNISSMHWVLVSSFKKNIQVM